MWKSFADLRTFFEVPRLQSNGAPRSCGPTTIREEDNHLMLMKVDTPAVLTRVALASALALAPAAALAQTSSQGQATSQGPTTRQTQTTRQTPGPTQVQSPSQQGQNAAQSQDERPGRIDIPFTSSSTETGEAQAVNGAFTIQRFVHEGSRVLAVGKITATTSNADGVARTVVTQARLPVLPSTAPSEVCSTLHLELGPLDVEVNGLRFETLAIAADIAAPTVDVSRPAGAQSELGAQLCSVGGLLDRGGVSNAGEQLATALNKVLELIG
jgi:hypothetical protein